MATPEEIQAVRYELADTDPALPVMADEEIEYFIDKNNGSIARATIDTAKSLLFKLCYRTDETIDILSIKGSKTAEAWARALEMFLKNPSLNSVLTTLNVYAGNISKSDMQANVANCDNNFVASPTSSVVSCNTSSNPFSI